MSKAVIIVAALIFVLGPLASAAPVDVPTQAQGLRSQALWSQDVGFAIGIAGEFEHIDKRKLDKYSGEVEADVWSGRIILSLTEVNMDFYATLGQIQDIEYEQNFDNRKKVADLEDKFMWGLGLNASTDLDAWGEDVVAFFDGKYRTARRMNFDALTVDGTRYTGDQVDVTSRGKWEEWHLAVGLGKRFDAFMPYGGVRYSDIRLSGEATAAGHEFKGDTLRSDNRVGIFVGCTLTPGEMFALDVQGRFIDEQALSVRGTVKF